MNTFGMKVVDKFSNYNYYEIGNHAAKKVDGDRLLGVIKKMQTSKYKKPYLRFLWVSNGNEEAMCALYDGSERKTKLLPFSEIEAMFG